MRTIKCLKNNQSAVIKRAIEVLKRGGVIVYPTETAYGLGADFFNPKATKKVYQIKGRSYKKPLAMIVSDFKMTKSLVNFDKTSLKLAKKYWPGALTIILNVKFNPPASLCEALRAGIQNYKTLGLRISSNKLATAIVKKLGKPLTATSANISGKNECYSAAEVIRQFSAKGGPASGWHRNKYQPDLVINAGRLAKTKVSTVVRVVDGEIEILRQGAVMLERSRAQRRRSDSISVRR